MSVRIETFDGQIISLEDWSDEFRARMAGLAEDAREESRPMNLKTVSIPADELEERLAGYEGELSKIDRLARKGLEAVKDGKQVVDLEDVIQRGGVWNDSGLGRGSAPKLAIARADMVRCSFWWATSGSIRYRSWRIGRECRITLRGALSTRGSHASGTTIVPYLPPSVRPRKPREHFVLWEAKWRMREPIDPALLQHLAGNLYIIEATWELTEVERAAIE